MVEATHTTESVYGLARGVGRGSKIWAANIEVTDAETLSTGLDRIEAVIATPIEAIAPTGTLKIVETKSVSAGVVTFVARQVTLTEATDANRVLGASTDTNAYVVVIGVVN